MFFFLRYLYGEVLGVFIGSCCFLVRIVELIYLDWSFLFDWDLVGFEILEANYLECFLVDSVFEKIGGV